MRHDRTIRNTLFPEVKRLAAFRMQGDRCDYSGSLVDISSQVRGHKKVVQGRQRHYHALAVIFHIDITSNTRAIKIE